MKSMDLLLLYVREDAAFARLSSDGAAVRDAEERAEVTEETLPAVLKTLISRVTEDCFEEQGLTVVYTLSRRVEVLKPCVSEALRALSFADSISSLSRNELYCHAVELCSSDRPRQLLVCDSRETRLFTPEREIFLGGGMRTGGNGFLDWLNFFAREEGESQEHFVRQIDRLEELFGIYKCFSAPENADNSSRASIYPDAARHPELKARPVLRDGIGFSEDKGLVIRRRARSVPKAEDAAAEELPINYAALSKADRDRLDRKYPALYRAVRDRFGNYKTVSIREAAEAFATLFDGITEAPLTELVVVGQYAHFPLTEDFLCGLPQKPTLSFQHESRLMLDALEHAASARIRSSRLSFHDMDGEELVLWDSMSGEGAATPKKRVSVPVLIRKEIRRDLWRKRLYRLPYTVTLTELRIVEDGSLVRVRTERTGDLREFCYRRMKDGFFRVKLPEREGEDGEYRAVLLGIGVTPCGICCRILSDADDISTTLI